MNSDIRATSMSYSCRCLNIRITTTVFPVDPPDYPLDPDYSLTFVDDDGIQVNHPQATVRLMSKPVPIPGTAKHSRFTVLTCLFCALRVYRVHHAISLDIEGNTTTFLPSEEWVEKDVLRSGTGWIDVHKDCWTTNDVAKALSAPTYVTLFALTLPGTLSSAPFPESGDETGSSPPEENKEDTNYLPEMKPIFLKPPFTPSNQVFIHLADVARKQSEILRSEAEERIRNFIKVEAARVLEKETIVKNQVLCFWKEFKKHLDELQLDIGKRTTRSPSRSRDHSGTNGHSSISGMSSSMAIRNFSPTPVRHATALPQPRSSALSASLAVSTLYYPKEGSRLSTESECTSSGSSNGLSPDSRSVSSTLVQSTASHGEEANVLQFRRTINDTINTQASYRYFAKEDMERHRRAKQDANHTVVVDDVQRKNAAPSATTNNHTEAETTPDAKEPRNSSPHRGRDKGKRKVTFDVKAAQLAIETNETVADEPVVPDQEAIFRLDDVIPEEDTEIPNDDTQNTLPLLEQPALRPISIKRRSLNTDAFQSLRPVSLPAPSHIRPLRSPPGVDSSHGILVLPKVASPTKLAQEVTRPASPLTENQQEILKLVAADVASHRGVWTPGSENWNAFTGKGPRGDTFEEGEEDEESTPIARTLATDRIHNIEALHHVNNDPLLGSLPMKIKRIEPVKPLGLSSYVEASVSQEEAELAPAAPSVVNGKKQSSSSIRKAVYLEKDRARALDPGPLDVVVEDDEVEDDDDFENCQDEGGKAQLQALRILQARSELPEEGMWRSLA